MSNSFIEMYYDKIDFIDKFNNFSELKNYFNNFELYIGGDTFYYHLMSKFLRKYCYIVFGSTSFRKFIYGYESTKYSYPQCANYPMYKRKFSEIKYCNECQSDFCINKVKLNLRS